MKEDTDVTYDLYSIIYFYILLPEISAEIRTRNQVTAIQSHHFADKKKGRSSTIASSDGSATD